MQTEATASSSAGGSASELELQLQVEQKIRDGAQNLLQVFLEAPSDGTQEQDGLRRQVERELDEAHKKIALLQSLIRNQAARLAPASRPATPPEEVQFLIAEHVHRLQGSLDAADQLHSLQVVTRLVDKSPALAAIISLHDVVSAFVPLLSDHAHKDVRSTALKVIRACCLDAETVTELEGHHLSWYLLR
jgi:hypothetical protein